MTIKYKKYEKGRIKYKFDHHKKWRGHHILINGKRVTFIKWTVKCKSHKRNKVGVKDKRNIS